MSTRSHTLYGQCLILLMAVTCYGQWDTNAWPAYLHSRAGKTHALNCFEAIKEKSYAVNSLSGSFPNAPSLWRSQRTYLINYKGNAKKVIPWFCNPINITNGSIEVFINNSTNVPDKYDSDMYILADYGEAGVVEICRQLKIPTNFFDYTPYRGLDGVGPFTNDAAVGHPYGWTNSDTLMGGSDFPSGRTQWYTTDYGWDNMKSVLNVLQYRCLSGGSIAPNDGYYGSSSTFTGLTLAEAKQEAVNILLTHTWPNSGSYMRYMISQIQDSPLSDYYVNLYNIMFNGVFPSGASVPLVSTNIIPYKADLWFMTSFPPPSQTNGIYGRLDSYPAIYNDFGLGLAKQGAWVSYIANNTGALFYEECYGWQLAASNTISSSAGKWQWSVSIGDTNFIPDWPTIPAYNGVNWTGFKLQGSCAVFLNFNGVTNGFKYK